MIKLSKWHNFVQEKSSIVFIEIKIASTQQGKFTMSGVGKILRHANKQRYTAHMEENMPSMEAHQKMIPMMKNCYNYIPHVQESRRAFEYVK